MIIVQFLRADQFDPKGTFWYNMHLNLTKPHVVRHIALGALNYLILNHLCWGKVVGSTEAQPGEIL
ncbi:MAG: hypothetical protein COB66_09415 [Coxiella sp. (in: Bacteria)]|nr:MAG: hypothetical protein COB66_09415 [Coxiella sp. (in: g-proteobacteria)]